MSVKFSLSQLQYVLHALKSAFKLPIQCKVNGLRSTSRSIGRHNVICAINLCLVFLYPSIYNIITVPCAEASAKERLSRNSTSSLAPLELEEHSLHFISPSFRAAERSTVRYANATVSNQTNGTTSQLSQQTQIPPIVHLPDLCPPGSGLDGSPSKCLLCLPGRYNAGGTRFLSLLSSSIFRVCDFPSIFTFDRQP